MKRVLFICTNNSARSQMAEGLLRKLYANIYDVYSAGTLPSGVKSEAIEVMKEIGIDIREQRSKNVDEFPGTLLTGANVENLYVAGCDPNMQRKMFRDAFDAANFPGENHTGIEIRNLDTDGVYSVINEAITQGE